MSTGRRIWVTFCLACVMFWLTFGQMPHHLNAIPAAGFLLLALAPVGY